MITALAPCASGRRLFRVSLALVAFLAGAPAPAASGSGSDPTVSYPEGYRTWFHVKSALVTSRHKDFAQVGGFRHIYANAEAVTGYRTGTFPPGSAIVVDWLEGQDDNGMFTESGRRRLDVMVKDPSRFAKTGGWGFERFSGDSRTERAVKSAATECFACHAGPGTRDLVFSRLRE